MRIAYAWQPDPPSGRIFLLSREIWEAGHKAYPERFFTVEVDEPAEVEVTDPPGDPGFSRFTFWEDAMSENAKHTPEPSRTSFADLIAELRQARAELMQPEPEPCGLQAMRAAYDPRERGRA